MLYLSACRGAEKPHTDAVDLSLISLISAREPAGAQPHFSDDIARMASSAYAASYSCAIDCAVAGEWRGCGANWH